MHLLYWVILKSVNDMISLVQKMIMYIIGELMIILEALKVTRYD